MQKGLEPAVLVLHPEEQKGLEMLVYRHSTPQQLALRGKIVLATAAGKRNAEIDRELEVNVDMVCVWRGCWIGLFYSQDSLQKV